MRNILVLFAHPKLEQSRANTALINAINDLPYITINDLYQKYPDFNIDIEYEKQLLLNNDVIVWHHPFYWYSCPPLLKQWIDTVLEYDWAYGPNGKSLWNKQCFNTITTGGTKELYCATGNNHYTISEFLRPFEQTATLCGMLYLPPFAIMGTNQLSDIEYSMHAEKYRKLMTDLGTKSNAIQFDKTSFLNENPKLN